MFKNYSFTWVYQINSHGLFHFNCKDKSIIPLNVVVSPPSSGLCIINPSFLVLLVTFYRLFQTCSLICSAALLFSQFNPFSESPLSCGNLRGQLEINVRMFLKCIWLEFEKANQTGVLKYYYSCYTTLRYSWDCNRSEFCHITFFNYV